MKIYIVVFNLLFFLPLSAQEEWSLKKNKDGIKIYTKAVDSSKIKSYKAVMLVKSTLDKVKETLINGNQLHTWNYNAIDSKLLKKNSESRYLIWMALDLPWPLRNRDFASLLELNRISKDVIRIDITAASDQYEIQEEYLRMTSFEGYWLLERKGTMIKITQQMYGDPGGSLPSWFINSTMMRAPYYNFIALRERVQ